MLTFTDMAVTATEALAYVDARGLTGWPVVGAEQDAALRRGQDYIAREYNGRWAVDFDDTTAPDVVKFAIIEAAIAEAMTPGALAPVVTPGQAKVLVEVKGIRWEPLRKGGGAGDMKPVLTAVQAMLAPYVISGGTSFVARA